MKAFEKKKPDVRPTRSESLACIPQKTPQVAEKILEDGNVLLDYTITVRPWFAGFLRRFGTVSDGRIKKQLQLDELGTQVWQMVDSRKSVRDLIQQFARTHQLPEREAEVAVTRFLRELGKRGLIGLL